MAGSLGHWAGGRVTFVNFNGAYLSIHSLITHPFNTSIINASLLASTFPEVWKTAEITPIPKQGNHELPNNNRPISLLPALSKVCERDS